MVDGQIVRRQAGFAPNTIERAASHGIEVALLGVFDLAVFFVSFGQSLKDLLKILRGKRVLLYLGGELGPVVENCIGAEKQAADLLKSVVIVAAQLECPEILDDPSRR